MRQGMSKDQASAAEQVYAAPKTVAANGGTN
jgi:hypothetical protein